MITYKISISLESKMTEMPNSSKIFGYIFGSMLKNNNFYKTTGITKELEKLSKCNFNISDLMPKGYVYNPSVRYMLNDYNETLTAEKSTLQKAYKKNTYIRREYLESGILSVHNESVFMKMENPLQPKYFKKYQTTINQHVQINTVEQDSNGEFNPQPFNLSSIADGDTEFEFYINFDQEYKTDIDRIFLTNKDKIVVLGGQSGKGYNIFSIGPNAVEEIKLSDSQYGIVMSQYIPSSTEEISGNLNGNDIKIKNASARPVKMIAGSDENGKKYKNESRFRYFYIDSGSCIKVPTSNYGKLISYVSNASDNYDPKLYGKSFIYPIGGLNESK